MGVLQGGAERGRIGCSRPLLPPSGSALEDILHPSLAVRYLETKGVDDRSFCRQPGEGTKEGGRILANTPAPSITGSLGLVERSSIFLSVGWKSTLVVDRKKMKSVPKRMENSDFFVAPADD